MHKMITNVRFKIVLGTLHTLHLEVFCSLIRELKV